MALGNNALNSEEKKKQTKTTYLNLQKLSLL